MPLDVVLETPEVDAGSAVRGRVSGLDGWPDAREARIALRHETKHLKSQPVSEAALEAGPGGEATFALHVPEDAYPTFDGTHYRSAWRAEVVVDRALKRDPSASAEVLVRPAPGPEPPAEPASGEWGGYRRFRRFLALFTAADLVALGAAWAVAGSVPPAALFAFLAPAAVSLLALAALSVIGSAVDRLEVRLPRSAWRFGEAVGVEVVLEAEPEAVPALAVALKGEEVWVTSTGQSTTTHREAVHEDERRLAGPDLIALREGARRWVWRLDLPLPGVGPPSRGKEVQWRVRAWVPLPRRPDPSASVDLEIAGRAG